MKYERLRRALSLVRLAIVRSQTRRDGRARRAMHAAAGFFYLRISQHEHAVNETYR